jgi:hypothetical protein
MEFNLFKKLKLLTKVKKKNSNKIYKNTKYMKPIGKKLRYAIQEGENAKLE